MSARRAGGTAAHLTLFRPIQGRPSTWKLRCGLLSSLRGTANHSLERSRLPCVHHSTPAHHAAIQGGVEKEPRDGNQSESRDDGQLYDAIQQVGFMVERGSYVPSSLLHGVLKDCNVEKDLDLGRRVHALTCKSGYESSAFLANDIIRMYVSHGRLQEAMQLFDKLLAPDTFLWFSIILAHADHGQPGLALQLYRQLQQSDAKPNKYIFVAVLKACGHATDLAFGREVHADILDNMGEPNVYVASSLVDMYTKCGSLGDARKVFDGLTVKDVVLWNAMMAGYAKNGLYQEALDLFASMQQKGITSVDRVTLACLLKACSGIGDLQQGKEFHRWIQEMGLQADIVLGSCLVDMYSKCGSLEDARRVFDKLTIKDVVTWNAMLGGYAQHGFGQECLSLYTSMQQVGVSSSNRVTFVCLLKAFSNAGDLCQGKKLHAEIQERGLESDGIIGNCLIDMYAKCGSLEDARRLFDGLLMRDVVSWNVMLSGYAQHGLGQEALTLYESLQQEAIASVDHITFAYLLKACANVSSLHRGRQVHSQILGRGLEADVMIGNSLVDMYAKCGSVEDACSVFNKLRVKDVVTWNAMLAGYVQHGLARETLGLYASMQQECSLPANQVTFVALLKACAGIGALHQGKEFHLQIQERGLDSEVVICNSLVYMYAKCGSLEDARTVFDRVPRKDLVTWNAMITGYAQHGMGSEALAVHSRMQQEGITPADHITLSALLKACASIRDVHQGKQIHLDMESKGLVNLVTGNCLVDMYAKCGSLEDARSVFDRLTTKDVVSWNAMLAGYAQHELGREALSLYAVMHQEGIIQANHVTFVCVLKACTSLGALHEGKKLHTEIQSSGLQDDIVIGNCLVDMYAKCGSLEDARRVFDRMPIRDVVTWTAMISGYAEHGVGKESLALYDRMQEEGVTPTDHIALACLLRACASVGALPQGKELHSQITGQGLETDAVICNCLMDMYAKCGSLEDARRVFERLTAKDIVTWNVMIRGYAQHGPGQEALALYARMQLERSTPPDHITFACLLKACASVGTLHKGEQLHAQIQDLGLEADVVVGSSLVDMYAKCGSLQDACKVFERLPRRDIVTWNAMIAGYAQHGCCPEALQCYEKMQEVGVKPDQVTFLSLLSACSHAGLVDKGIEYFATMSRDHGLTPDIQHYVSMVDLYGRAGCFTLVRDLLSKMPVQPDLAMCLCLLGACRKHGNVELGEEAFYFAVRLQPTHAASYMLMSQIYSDAGLLERALEVHVLRQSEGAWKKQGKSWIECEQQVQTFVVGDHEFP